MPQCEFTGKRASTHTHVARTHTETGAGPTDVLDGMEEKTQTNNLKLMLILL